MVGFRAVGFDLDGTLFDHAGAARRAIVQFVSDVGGRRTEHTVSRWFEIEAEEFESWRSGRGSFVDQRRRRLQRFLPLIGVADYLDDAALDAHFASYLSSYRREWRLFPGTRESLLALRESGARIGVLTNGDPAQQRDKLTALGLLPLLDAVCISGEIGSSKPDPRSFGCLVDSLGVERSQVLFIGDSEYHDVLGARAVGIRSALVDDSTRVDRISAAIRLASGVPASSWLR